MTAASSPINDQAPPPQERDRDQQERKALERGGQAREPEPGRRVVGDSERERRQKVGQRVIVPGLARLDTGPGVGLSVLARRIAGSEAGRNLNATGVLIDERARRRRERDRIPDLRSKQDAVRDAQRPQIVRGLIRSPERPSRHHP